MIAPRPSAAGPVRTLMVLIAIILIVAGACVLLLTVPVAEPSPSATPATSTPVGQTIVWFPTAGEPV